LINVGQGHFKEELEMKNGCCKYKSKNNINLLCHVLSNMVAISDIADHCCDPLESSKQFLFSIAHTLHGN